MRSSRTITLFAPPPLPLRRDSSSVVTSVVVHGLVCGCLIFGVRTAPRVSNRSAIRRYTVRVLNVPMPEPVVEQTAGISVPRPVAKAAAGPQPAPGGSPASMPDVATRLAQLPRRQILIQPDAPPDVLLQHPTPIPLVLRWTPPDIPVKVVTLAPPPQKSLLAKLRPSIEPPNRELTLADIRVSSTNLATALATLPASTTSPIVVRGPEPARRIPETYAKQLEQPAPAQIMSLSDLQSQQGPVAIPLANAPGRPVIAASPAMGPAVNSGEGGHGDAESRQSGNGAGPSPATAEAKAGGSGGPAAPSGAKAEPEQEQELGLDGGPGTSVTRIHLNKDGQFGVVVVGSTLAEQYPETVGLWGGRLVYTVYLHLGKGKAWILQYAVPPAAQAATPTNAGRPEAPWPYDIVQPHLDPNDYTSDAVMVHGFVNLAGRFERLAVVFPTEFAQAKFVLTALQQWQFRPARQNGQLAPVEVLLIIPEETE